MDQNREVSRQLMAEQLASFAGVDCVFFDENTEESMESSDGSSSANSVCADSSFRRKLLGHSRAQEEPLICADRHDVVYLCLNGSAGFLFFGPIALRAMNRVELHRFYRDHEVRGTEDPPIPIMSISKILLLADGSDGCFESFLYGRGTFKSKYGRNRSL